MSLDDQFSDGNPTMHAEQTFSLTNDSREGPGAVAARTRPYLLGLLVGWVIAQAASLTGITQSPALDPDAGGIFTVFALSTVFFLHCTSGRHLREIGVTAGIGLAASVVAVVGLGKQFLAALSGGLAGASVAVLALAALRAKAAERKAALDVLLPALAFPGFVFVSSSYLALTAALRPAVWDGYAFRADAAFGFQASFAVGRLFKAVRPLAQFSRVVYAALPLALAAVHALATRRKVRKRSPDVVAALVVLGVVGYALYFVFPVVGPVYILRGYPAVTSELTLATTLPLGAYLVAYPMPRNCMPSLHAAWALMTFWLTWAQARWVRALAAIFLAFTLLATLGLGVHYLVDIVAAVPFAAAVYGFLAEVETGSVRLRRVTIAASTALLVGWLALVRLAPDLLAGVPPAMCFLAATVVGLPWAAVAMLQRRLAPGPGNLAARAKAPALRREQLVVASAFFLSGFAALCYEVVFAKAFAVAFGSTARATTTVLAVYMGGLALGSWLGGRWASRIERPLRAFALVEIGVALWCAGFPLAFAGVRAAYLALAAGTDPAAAWLILFQMALQAAALLPATLLMGCSLPLLARHLTARAESVGSAVGSLYGINTAGAAAGTLVGGYVLLPALGITHTVFAAVALDVLAATFAILLSVRTEGESRAAPHPRILEAGPAPERLRRLGWIALVVTFLGGVLTFALETTHIHLLAVVAGNSTYAFSLMVFAFLVGLSGGAVAGRRLLRTGIGLPNLLVACQMGLALVLLLGTYLWNEMPAHFATYQHYMIVREFGAREAVRFAVCSVAMIPPAFFIGAAYPLVMAWVGAVNPGREISAIGRAGALNTAGNILGAILGGFVLIPLFGSLRSVQLIAITAVALGVLALLAAQGRRSPWGLALAMVASLVPLQPRSLDYTRLASGANVYFEDEVHGRVIDHAESEDGGLTTIAESQDPGGRRVLTMLTNGKFQGDDSHRREIAAQLSFSLFPLLHTDERGPALIIGLGTGVSARVASDAGFTPLHIAELSKDVADLATRYFASTNGNVLARPDTVLHVTDGRNLLALDSRRYGFIGLEVSSIWFAGAANLYNREFYAIARAHLTQHGVLQQWVQMHRLSHADLLSIVATARAEFPYVWLYFTPNQGVLVACAWDCKPSESSIRRLTTEPRLAADLDLVGGAAKLLERRVLGPDDVDNFVGVAREFGPDPEQLVSTDDNLLLEYSTPRANVRPYEESLADNLQFVRRFAPRSPIAGTTLTAAQWDSLRAVADQPIASP